MFLLNWGVGSCVFTMGSLVQSMLHHMMEAQALPTWLLLEITTTGRVLAWTDTGADSHSELQRCVRLCHSDSPGAHLDGALQASMPEIGHKVHQVEFFGDPHASLMTKKQAEFYISYIQTQHHHRRGGSKHIFRKLRLFNRSLWC